MVVDFSKLNFKERQTLILKNLDGTYLQPLAFAKNLQAKLYYNEVSELTFELPAFVDGQATPGYDDVVGMRLIDWYGIGQFILVNPSITNDGISEIKSCKAYSLEYEMTYKTLYLEEGTYNFWNPVASEDTFLGRLLEVVPSWSVGSVDASLIGKYRTFGVDNNNAYQAAKELQEAYQCIFDFDTYNRTINVRAVSDLVDVKPIYLSMENLIKEIQIEEDTENIFTCLDVNGADGVDIRGVNPLGTNKIYNLDYFMNATYFDQWMIDKWNAWKSNYNDSQASYFNITVEKVLKEAQLETERAALTELNGELSTLEEMQSLYVEASAQGIDRNSELAKVKSDISNKRSEISAKENAISIIETTINALTGKQKSINERCNLESYFSDEEILLLNRYMKETSISEDSFVYQEVSSYIDKDVSLLSQTVHIAISESKITGTKSESGIIYSCIGGNAMFIVGGKEITARLVRAALEKDEDESGLLTAYLDSGVYDGVPFATGCISLTGVFDVFATDVSEDPDIGGKYVEGSTVSGTFSAANLYFTKGATEYTKRSVEWDLFTYGLQNLEELSWPTYSFSVDSANFLALDDFIAFKNQLSLGAKAYLNLRQGVLTPIAIGIELGFDDPSDFKILFGDKYSLNDSAFKLVDLLDQSVAMGKTVASNLKKFNAFIESGASTELKDYISSALDASKQAILAGVNQSTSIDGSGIRLRKWNSSVQDYDPEQIWMVNNNIVFTDNNWDTAKMALGHIVNTDEGIDAWGLVADLIVGKLLAGENLVIESLAADGNTIAFRVDSNGAVMHNGRFDLVRGDGQISLFPETGFVGGKSTASAPLYEYDDNGNIVGVLANNGSTLTSVTQITSSRRPNANFWIDMDGNAYFRGKVYGTDGEFSGTLKASVLDGTLTAGASGGEITGVSLNIGDGNFTVDRWGNANIAGAVLSNSEMYSPTITGDTISTYGVFEAKTSSGQLGGYLGAATGRDSGGTTYGIAMTDHKTAAVSGGKINYDTVGRYVIVTESGVRLQAGSNSLVVRDDGIWLNVEHGSAWYNDDELGTGGAGTAVFG